MESTIRSTHATDRTISNDPIRRFLRRYALRVRLGRLGFRLMIALAILFAWTLAICFIDRCLSFPPAMRWGLWMGLVIILSGSVANPFLRMFAPVDAVATALRVETEYPKFAERLVTVVSIRSTGPMLDRLRDDVIELIQRRPSRQFIQRRGVGVVAMSVGVLAIAWAILLPRPALGLPVLAQRVLTPWRAIDPLNMTHLAVGPGNVVVNEQEVVAITARVWPRPLEPPVLWVSDNGQSWTRSAMAADAQQAGFSSVLRAAERDLQYCVTAGNARSAVYTIGVKRPPAVVEFEVGYVYPAYMHRPPRTVRNTDGAIDAPPGAQVTLALTATEPLRSATLNVENQRLQMERVDDTHWHASIPLEHEGAYSLEMITQRGAEGRGPGQMMLRIIPDRPPTVRLLAPAVDRAVGAEQVLRLAYDANDVYGIASLVVHVRVNGSPAASMAIPVSGRHALAEALLDWSDLNVREGDVAEMWLQVEGAQKLRASSEHRWLLVTAADQPGLPGQCARWVQYASDLATSGDRLGVVNALLAAEARADSPQLADCLASFAIRMSSGDFSDSIGSLAVLSRGLRARQILRVDRGVQAWIQSQHRVGRVISLEHAWEHALADQPSPMQLKTQAEAMDAILRQPPVDLAQYRAWPLANPETLRVAALAVALRPGATAGDFQFAARLRLWAGGSNAKPTSLVFWQNAQSLAEGEGDAVESPVQLVDPNHPPVSGSRARMVRLLAQVDPPWPSGVRWEMRALIASNPEQALDVSAMEGWRQACLRAQRARENCDARLRQCSETGGLLQITYLPEERQTRLGAKGRRTNEVGDRAAPQGYQESVKAYLEALSGEAAKR